MGHWLVFVVDPQGELEVSFIECSSESWSHVSILVFVVAGLAMVVTCGCT